ncbi:hypothetical protein FSP39_018472 [Pinctada imbricata]|uniref:Uncharacterized protein n=1 Tax=Pinctada imbricata TaxID=66713 RepID=A0AA89BTX6_PINIB|nr:hypothetical protein FSP39_018472 [Pinctada imbricata]
METSMNFMGAQYDDITKSMTEMKGLIEKKVKKEITDTKELVNENCLALNELMRARDELRETVKDLQCRSMRDNLVFSGIHESSHEDTEEVLQNFIRDELELTQDFNFERVHRIGREQGHRPRAIVAKFTSFKQREIVRKSGPKLKGKRYGINEQFPKDVMDTRRSLLPIFRDAKRQGKEAKLVVDKLYVSGRRVYPRIDRERNMPQSIGMDLDTNDTAGAGANRD